VFRRRLMPVAVFGLGGLVLAGAAPASARPAAPGKPAAIGKTAALGKRTLHVGLRGPDVRLLQRELTLAGVRTHADGQYGPLTARHVAMFEREQNLKPADGVFRPSDAVPLSEAADASVAGGAQAFQGGSPGRSRPSTPAAAPPAPLAPGDRAQLQPDGTAIAPASAPLAVQQMIQAGNQIAKLPYRYGGGHVDNFQDNAYDCSGSVSYSLHGAGLLDSPDDSTGLESFGSAGPGRWVTIYANADHTFMFVAGLRFDTSGATAAGSRWQTASRDTSGYVVRHPNGL